MKGDFSRWQFDERSNAQGVLHQQGRVLLDADWNAQTRLAQRWRDEAARATIGSNVAAVAAAWGDSFKVLEAEAQADGTVRLVVVPGQVWADGWLTYLRGDAPDPEAPVERVATFLGPPLQTPPADLGATGTRDAVVLEVHREALNAFQSPQELLEAALGGVDTTERVLASLRWRLYRMGEDDTCASLDLGDDLESRGRLTARLQPTVIVPGDCPVVQAGGYTGFEHNLYRLEIAEVDPASGGPFFKWSQFNGGLVGRGTFDVAQQKLRITANDQAILRSGLTDFYLEVLAPSPDRPPAPAALDPERSAELAEAWDLIYGAEVSLANDGQIDLPAPGDPSEFFGSIPTPDTRSFFFRLWNGIEAVADYPIGGATPELRDGIELEFEDPASNDYVAGDFWTFPVRVGDDDQTLIDDEPPEGVVHVRVPLAQLLWTGAAGPITAADDEIEDCRRPFQPLTRLSTCCTYRVGDGVNSFGDFTAIQDAINALPDDGGTVCVLPGTYEESVLIENRDCVTLEGCGKRSKIVGAAPVGGGEFPGDAEPAVTVRDSNQVRVERLAIEAHATGVGVLVEETLAGTGDPGTNLPFEPMKDVALIELDVTAATQSGIEVAGGEEIVIRCNRVEMEDVESRWPAVTIEADDVLLEDNELLVGEAANRDAAGNPLPLVATGGLWLRGGCNRVRVVDNLIQGGIGNGVTLGHVELEVDGELADDYFGVIGGATDLVDHPCWSCDPGTGTIPEGGGTEDDPTTLAGPPLEDILIDGNRILEMGLNGIGVRGFFEADEETISVADLTIRDNHIHDCLERSLENVTAEMLDRLGFGGVVLADVETLLVTGNRIEDNGKDYLEPICGVYVEHGDGVDVSGNRILNNGGKTSDSVTDAKRGPRGGVFIQSAEAPIFEIDANDRLFPNVRGIPAAKVHDNVISTPLGKALTINALGPVSVVGNQLTSHGVPLSESVGATVSIINFGLPTELALLGFLLSFFDFYEGLEPHATEPVEGLEILRRNPFNGNVMFNDNQVLLELLELGVEFVITSVLILSLDDVAVEDNQIDCELLIDFVFMNALIFGLTTRVTGNRFKEGLLFALISAWTLGFFNLTTHNEGTHCIFASWFGGGAGRRRPNLQLLEHLGIFGQEGFLSCGRWRQIFEFGKEGD